MSDYGYGGYGGPAPTGGNGYGAPGDGYGGPGGPGWRPPAAPVGVGELLGETTRAIVGNLPTFLIASLLFSLPSQILTAIGTKRFTDSIMGMVGLGQGGVQDPAALFEAIDFTGIFIILGAALVGLVCNFICQGVLVYPSAESVAGNRVAPGDALAKGFRAAPSVLLISFVLMLFYILATMPGMVLWFLMIVGMGAVDGASGGGGGGALVAMCCGCPVAIGAIFVPIYWVFILFLLSIPSAVVERVGPVRGLQRSIELTRGHRWKLVGGTMVIFLILIVVGVMGNIAMIPFGGGMDASTGQFTGPSTMGTVVGAIVGTVQSMLSLILFSAFAGTAYARIRGADEGVDAASIANVFS
ncbi:MAG: hypothetical protein CMN30_17180 [Sandaracinus sp.]|nr:hypothetical protein [Sandaracinus sp.]